MPRPLLSRSGASVHHRNPAKTFRGRALGVLLIHASEIHQGCLPALLPRRPQWHLTQQLGRIREQQSINFSEHVSILGLQTFAGRFPKANEEQSNQQQKPLLPSTNGNESFILPQTSRPYGCFHHQDSIQCFAD